MPRISIIIPIYNTEKYLKDCLISVQRQTVDDIEIILVNDCSPDNSMQIAYKFAEKDKRVKIIEHEENGGPGKARNTGLEAASGDYVNFLDSDDQLPANALQLMLSIAEENRSDMIIGNMAWLYGHNLIPVDYIDSRIRSWKTCWTNNLRKIHPSHYLSGSMCHRLIKTQIFQEKMISFPVRVLHEDVPVTLETWFFSSQITATRHFVYYRTRREEPNNLSRTQTYNEKAFLDRDTIAQKIYDFSINHEAAYQLGAITLSRMFSTTNAMLNYANDDIRFKITSTWFPMHAIKINSMIDKLNHM